MSSLQAAASVTMKPNSPIARTAVSLLAKAGVDIGIMGADEVCCGQRAYDTGYRQEFSDCAEKNISAWKKAGVKTIVTSCADCYHAFKRLYPQMGSQFEVLHTVEYLDRLIKKGKIKLTKKVPLKVTYHDPCYLGRHGEPYVPWEGKEKKLRIKSWFTSLAGPGTTEPRESMMPREMYSRAFPDYS